LLGTEGAEPGAASRGSTRHRFFGWGSIVMCGIGTGGLAALLQCRKTAFEILRDIIDCNRPELRKKLHLCVTKRRLEPGIYSVFNQTFGWLCV